MNGLIAFFDILGYQSFLENNSAMESKDSTEQTSRTVLNLINNIPERTKKILTENWLSDPDEKFSSRIKEIVTGFDHLIFSDTIVLSIKYPENVSENWKVVALLFLQNMSQELGFNMFREGLPLRGAIVEGDFAIDKNCFAGKAIVDAYNLCHSLNLSGVVLDKGLNERLLTISDAQSFRRHYVSYLTPQKKSFEDKLFHINWLAELKEDDFKAIKQDVDIFVLRSFWAHNKDCKKDVEEKIVNTIRLVRRLIIAREEGR